MKPVIDSQQSSQSVLPIKESLVKVYDMRKTSGPSSLDREGFVLLQHSSAIDLDDTAVIEEAYRDELAGLFQKITGSRHVYVHPKIILRSNNNKPESSGGLVRDVTAPIAHSDLTDRSAWSEARLALGRHGSGKMPGGKLLVYTTWRSLGLPPQDLPLALCDLRSLRREHFVRADSRGNIGSIEHSAEFYLLLHDKSHRWCYFPDLTRDELLVFKQFDSAVEGPSGCPHTAFSDPGCKLPVPTRISLEARVFVFPDADKITDVE